MMECRPRFATSSRLNRDERLFDDAVGYRHALVLSPETLAAHPQLDEVAESANVALVTDGAPALREWLAEAGVVAILVRPDRYVHGVARDAADLHALLAVAFPRLQAMSA
jgi:3-(3-hydroxy-phenyl)propionate hydroxylase